MRNEVRVSRVLATTLGSLPLGSTVALKPLNVRSSPGALEQIPAERQDLRDGFERLANVNVCVHVSLRWCPPSEAVLATGSVPTTERSPSFSGDDEATVSTVSSPSSQLTPKHRGHQRAVTASPLGKSSGSESPVGSRGTPRQRKDAHGLQNWAAVRASLEKSKERVKALLETFAARWIAGRYLLAGNLVHLPLSGCDCIFLVSDSDPAAETSSEPSDASGKGNNALCTDAQRTGPVPPLAVFVVDHNTKVTLLLPPDLAEEPPGTAGLSRANSSGQEEGPAGLRADVDRIEYSSLGGLSVQIEKLKQHVELSLLRPQYLTR